MKNIKELAKKLKLSEETLRKWEVKFLIEVPRNQKNNRYYPENIENIFCKIKELKDLNFIDDNIKKELSSLYQLNLNLNTNEINLSKINTEEIKIKESNLFIEEIKNTIKESNDLALKLSNVSAEMGFLKGQLKYIEEENFSLKKELNLNSIELKKISELQAIINLKEKDFFSKEKKIIELEAKLNLTKIELENKDYIINTYKNNEVELQNKINELQNKLIELNKIGFLEKIKKIF